MLKNNNLNLTTSVRSNLDYHTAARNKAQQTQTDQQQGIGFGFGNRACNDLSQVIDPSRFA